jgi:hypothetical protein
VVYWTAGNVVYWTAGKKPKLKNKLTSAVFKISKHRHANEIYSKYQLCGLLYRNQRL